MSPEKKNHHLRTVKITARDSSGEHSRSGSRSRKNGRPKKRNVRLPAPEEKKRLVRKLVRLFAAVFLCALLGASIGLGAKAFANWLTHSPRFAIRELVIRTGSRVSKEEVQMLANLKVGDNILSFHLAECVQGIEIHPWVKRATVMRELPDRVVIEVKERKPVAVIALDSLYYVDEDGEIFKKLLPGEDRDYPVLTGISLQEVVANKEALSPLMSLALEVLGLARQSRILPLADLSEIHLDHTTGATVVRAQDGMRLRLGWNNFPDKWVRLERTLIELGEDAAKVAELDLNYEGRATIRLREGYRVASAEEATPGK